MSDNLNYGTLYQHLVHNEKPIRQAAMRKLRDFLSSNEETLDLPELLKVWRGLFYCYWMSDKEEIQQEFARSLASSMHLWGPELALHYFDAFLQTASDRWTTIDHDRMNKYLNLVRRMLEGSFIYLRIYSWDEEVVSRWSNVISRCLRQVPNAPRGLSLHLIEIYLHSWAISFTQDVYFNDLNIDEILQNSEYDDSMSLEELYYQKYLYRKHQRHGREAQQRYHARKASKRVGSAPLDFKHTREGLKAAKREAGKPKNAQGKYLHTNPIAYLLHRKTKKERGEDTPLLSKEIEKASRENLIPTPPASAQLIMEAMLNVFKLASSDQALRDVLQEHIQHKFVVIIKRFIKDMRCAEDEIENDDDEITEDALGTTCATMLRSFVISLRSKARSNPTDFLLTQTKTKKIDMSKLSLEDLPLTTRTRGFYNGFAGELEGQITKLLALGTDFDMLEAQGGENMFEGGEGEMDESMMYGGEGEFDPSMFDDGEGEITDEQMRAFMEEMGEGEDFNQFDNQDVYGSDDDVQLGEGDQDDFDFDALASEGEDGFPFGLFGEGEDFDPYAAFYGEGEDVFDSFDDGEGESGFDIPIDLLTHLFGEENLKLDHLDQPILTQDMQEHILEYIEHFRKKKEIEAVMDPQTISNTKYNQEAPRKYVPPGNAKWNYGFTDDKMSDSDEDCGLNAKKRKQPKAFTHSIPTPPPAHQVTHSNKKQKIEVPSQQPKQHQHHQQQSKKDKKASKKNVDFDLKKNHTKTFIKGKP